MLAVQDPLFLPKTSRGLGPGYRGKLCFSRGFTEFMRNQETLLPIEASTFAAANFANGFMRLSGNPGRGYWHSGGGPR